METVETSAGEVMEGCAADDLPGRRSQTIISSAAGGIEAPVHNNYRSDLCPTPAVHLR